MIGRFLRISHDMHPITVFFALLIIVPSFSSSEAEDVANYKICSERYDCGSLQNLTYPFWGGSNRPQSVWHQGFELKCEVSPHPVLVRHGPDLMVLNISQASKRMTLARLDFWELDFLEFHLCPLQDVANTSLNETLFRSNPEENTLLNVVYNCTSLPDAHKQNVLSCPPRLDGFFYESKNDTLAQEALKKYKCEAVVEVPVPLRDLDSGGLEGVEDVETLVKRGFNVSYEYGRGFPVCDQCVDSGGVCGTNTSSSGFACLCRNKSFPFSCPPGAQLLPLLSLVLMVKLEFQLQNVSKQAPNTVTLTNGENLQQMKAGCCRTGSQKWSGWCWKF